MWEFINRVRRPSGLCLWLTVCCGLGISLAGCQQDSVPPGGGELTVEAPELDPAKTADGDDVDSKEDESAWEGRWKLVITEQRTDFTPFLLQIEDRGKQRMMQILDRAPGENFKEWKLVNVGFQPEGMMLAIDTGSAKLVFEGTKHEGVMLGSVYSLEQRMPTQARLVKVSEANLRGVSNPANTTGIEDFEKALQSPADVIKNLTEFVSKHADSPLVFDAYRILLGRLVADNQPVDAVEAVAEKSVASAKRWAGPLLLETYLEILGQLDFRDEYRPLITDYLELTRGAMGEEPTEFVGSRFRLFEGRYLITSMEPAEQAQGVEKLQAMLQEQPFEFSAILSLAKHFELNEEQDQALSLYAKLAVLPGMSRMVPAFPDPATNEPTTLAKKVRSLFSGDDEKFQEFLTAAYKKEAFYFVGDKPEPIEFPKQRRVPLIELFTGAMCPPCVAGDLALGGLEQLYPSPEVLIVRYHQHIPGPDPLTNAAGEARFGYYGGRGTPALFLNGQPWESVGGMMVHAEQVYQSLLPKVSSLMIQSSPVQIELETKLDGSLLTISSRANAITSQRKSARLRLLLVETMIDYVAPNGIRQHEMVVRDLPGGLAGAAVSESKAELNVTVDLAELMQNLKGELESFEKNRKYQFPEIPLELTSLQVIAFVQDDETKAILQSAVSPVITVESPAAKEAAEKVDSPAPPATPAESPVEKTPAATAPAEESKPAAAPEKPEPPVTESTPEIPGEAPASSPPAAAAEPAAPASTPAEPPAAGESGSGESGSSAENPAP